jgi:hypothetical protein
MQTIVTKKAGQEMTCLFYAFSNLPQSAVKDHEGDGNRKAKFSYIFILP